jgi:hypothetical protein
MTTIRIGTNDVGELLSAPFFPRTNEDTLAFWTSGVYGAHSKSRVLRDSNFFNRGILRRCVLVQWELCRFGRAVAGALPERVA